MKKDIKSKEKFRGNRIGFNSRKVINNKAHEVNNYPK